VATSHQLDTHEGPGHKIRNQLTFIWKRDDIEASASRAFATVPPAAIGSYLQVFRARSFWFHGSALMSGCADEGAKQ